ncbi:MAG: hypothetical protein KME05_20160 [Gloeocapsa sp. UFS-A4-WI-NPMV-4B04]|nr:hypothetical protein [Gloeocapsa sp. UFS-A4-WI-NPMV-4B04]
MVWGGSAARTVLVREWVGELLGRRSACGARADGAVRGSRLRAVAEQLCAQWREDAGELFQSFSAGERSANECMGKIAVHQHRV